MSNEKEILSRIESLENKLSDDNYRLPRNEIMGILDCAKRDMVIQQKKYQRILVREKLSFISFKKKVFKRLLRLEISIFVMIIAFIIFYLV